MEYMNPKVSVVMPAYNGEKYIGEAIESILNQTYSNWEFIIVEDQSTDKTLDIIRRYADPRISLYQNNEHRGIAYSTNFAIRKSTGKYIALLDDDDIALSRRLEWEVAYLEEHETVDVLGARSALIDRDGRFIRYDEEPIHNPKLIKAYLLFYNKKFANCTVMYRKDFVEENNISYQEDCLGMQDFKFYIDCSKIGTISSVDYLVHLKRMHEDQETVRRLKAYTKERAELYAKFQNESIEISGFRLKKEEMRVINELIPEKAKDDCSKEDIMRLYHVFNKMIRQAQEMKIDYLTELEYACKKILGNRILVKSDIFNSSDEFLY